MKKFSLSIGIVASILFLGCDKVEEPNTGSGGGLAINLISYENDTSFVNLTQLTPQQPVLLMQEFTGVYCYTCPLAHAITKDVMDMFPGQVAAMNIHSHYFSIYDDPNVMGNLYDLRTQAGDSIVNMLGGVLSVPSAAFNMKHLPGEASITSNTRANWVGYATNELTLTPTANVELATEFDASSRNLKVVAKYHVLEDMLEDMYSSVFLVEDSIVDKQFVDTAVVNDYNQMHILRDAVTDARSDFLASTPTKGMVFIKVYNYTVPAAWNENNIEVISYIHQKDASWDAIQTAVQPIQ